MSKEYSKNSDTAPFGQLMQY